MEHTKHHSSHYEVRSQQNAEPATRIKNTPVVGVFWYQKATTGLEPVMGVLQTLALPTWLRRQKIKTDTAGRSGHVIPALRVLQSGRRGSNSQPSPWQGDVLPIELHPHKMSYI